MRLTGAVLSSDPKDFDFHKSEVYAGASPTIARDYDFRHLHTWRLQQAPSCVGVSMNSKAQALAAAQGRPFAEPLSYTWSWTGARMASSPPVPGQPLPITGSNGHENMKHARDRGFRLESAFPDIPKNHDRVPPASAWGAPAVAKLGRWHRIMGERNPDKLRDGILNAFRLLERGECSPPGAVREVGSASEAAKNQVWNGDVGSSWGHHDEVMLTYWAAQDAVGLGSSWEKGVIYYVPVPILAACGAWFSVIESLIYPEPA